LQQESEESIATTSINIHELLYGFLKFAKPTTAALRLPAVPYGGEDAELSAKIEVALERKGVRVRRLDAMIAAIAIRSGAQLFSFDKKHFEPISDFGLKLLG
jgi:predicted nucleic acid-binding protein